MCKISQIKVGICEQEIVKTMWDIFKKINGIRDWLSMALWEMAEALPQELGLF